MKSAAKFILTFVVLYFLSALVLGAVLPPLTSWHYANCMSNGGASCGVSAFFLMYWWLLLMPFLLVIAYLINRLAFSKTTKAPATRPTDNH